MLIKLLRAVTGLSRVRLTLSPPDTIAPKVDSVFPKEGAIGVARRANVTATFSEDMMSSSINVTTFTLRKKGSSGTVSASITYVPETRTAILDPSVERLRSGATYVAKVTQAAKDMAGIALDQNPNTEVDEPKTWSFRVR